MRKPHFTPFWSQIVHFAKRLLWRLAPKIYWHFAANRLRGQQFSIAMFGGSDISTLEPLNGSQSPILTREHVTDTPAVFVADPFMIRVENTWHMFFEVLDAITSHGKIGYATSQNARDWTYRCIVLDEPFHLAYPYVFAHAGDVYMIPDSPGSGIRLYRAKHFPFNWELVSTIREEGVYSDSSILHHDNFWWLLTAWSPKSGENKTLRLFRAADLFQEWQEHPASPVVADDQQIVRPGGRICHTPDGRLFRFAQDCTRNYGESVRAVEILELGQNVYLESKLVDPILSAGKELWRSGGMHHIDLHQENSELICCVDGWRFV